MFTVGGLILGAPAFFDGLPPPGAFIGGSDGDGADMVGISSCDGAGGGGGGVVGSGASAPVLGMASTAGGTGRGALYCRRRFLLRRCVLTTATPSGPNAALPLLPQVFSARANPSSPSVTNNERTIKSLLFIIATPKAVDRNFAFHRVPFVSTRGTTSLIISCRRLRPAKLSAPRSTRTARRPRVASE